MFLIGQYGDQNDGKLRCPAENPTWCICKWATAKWIKGEGCNEVSIGRTKFKNETATAEKFTGPAERLETPHPQHPFLVIKLSFFSGGNIHI